MLVHCLRPLPRISRFFEDNCDMWGARVIGALWALPDRMVHSIELCHYLEPSEESGEFPFNRADYLIKHQSAIPRTDTWALREVDKEIDSLIGIKAARQSKGLDVSDLERDLQMLSDYRRENTRPDGRIKNFGDEANKTYQRHMTGIRRLLEKAKADCPEAYYYVKAHLLTGTYFFWSSEDLSANQDKSPGRHKPRKRTRGKAATRKSKKPRHLTN